MVPIVDRVKGGWVLLAHLSTKLMSHICMLSYFGARILTSFPFSEFTVIISRPKPTSTIVRIESCLSYRLRTDSPTSQWAALWNLSPLRSSSVRHQKKIKNLSKTPCYSYQDLHHRQFNGLSREPLLNEFRTWEMNRGSNSRECIGALIPPTHQRCSWLQSWWSSVG